MLRIMCCHTAGWCSGAAESAIEFQELRFLKVLPHCVPFLQDCPRSLHAGHLGATAELHAHSPERADGPSSSEAAHELQQGVSASRPTEPEIVTTSPLLENVCTLLM